ncbi:heat shock protein [Aureococcus anophagefferens]|uniref:Heat shock protein n=1 Tax=Aureococcus anophagefferens TaxID=44056 RepID=A0ABR1FWM5_AURAN
MAKNKVYYWYAASMARNHNKGLLAHCVLTLVARRVAPLHAPIAHHRATQRRATQLRSVAQDVYARAPPDERRAAQHAPLPRARSLRDELPGLARMARPNTLPMGAALVAAGAWGTRGAPPAAADVGSALRLGVAVACTTIVTAGSMLINDYFDHKHGVDTRATKPDRPLVAGDVRPATVKLVLKWAYAALLALICLIDTATMRLWVLANALATYVYTRHLKPVPVVKNAACAAVVAMAVGLGGLARGGGVGSLAPLGPAMAATAGLICHREMLMDCKDRDGTRRRACAPRRSSSGGGGPRRCRSCPSPAPSPRPRAAPRARAPRPGRARARPLARPSGAELRDAIELAPLWLAATLVLLLARARAL